MKSKLILALITILFFQCSPDKKKAIIGKWKIDSVYTYYNGFHFTRKDVGDEPLIEYLQDGKLKMTRGPESRMFAFEIDASDTLIHRTREQREMEKFVIQRVDADKLILRRDMRPIFKSMNQERYEVRYLSKQVQ